MTRHLSWSEDAEKERKNIITFNAISNNFRQFSWAAGSCLLFTLNLVSVLRNVPHQALAVGAWLLFESLYPVLGKIMK